MQFNNSDNKGFNTTIKLRTKITAYTNKPEARD